jgi:hypothetical protein
MCVCLCVYVCMYMYVCVCVCVYIYIYRRNVIPRFVSISRPTLHSADDILNCKLIRNAMCVSDLFTF